MYRKSSYTGARPAGPGAAREFFGPARIVFDVGARQLQVPLRPAGIFRPSPPFSVSKHQPSTNMAKTKTAKKVIKKAPAKKAKAKSAKKAR